jgi:uncharacterized protein
VLLSVRELELKKLRFDVSFAPGEIEYLDARLSQVSPLHAVGEAELLANTLGEIRLQGRFTVEMETECDRCLEPARFPIDTSVDLFYRPAAPVHTSHHAAEEVAIDEGEAEIAFYEGAGLDLKEVLREQVLLALPMQKICREDCHGICPVCGQNRNLVNCDCHQETGDDRWAALKKLSTK